MKTVNALTIRNKLGEVLDYVETEGQPVLVSKGRRVRAALIPIEDFKRRFLDKQAEDERRQLLDRIRSLQAPSRAPVESVEVLRELRGGSA